MEVRRVVRRSCLVWVVAPVLAVVPGAGVAVLAEPLVARGVAVGAGASGAPDGGTLAEPTFEYRIDRVRRTDLLHTWRPGCPVGPRRLRMLTVSHWGFDGSVKTGRLVVARNKARPIVRVLRKLFRAGYPIKRMRLVDDYDGSDRRSMDANNSSGFNCRTATGSTAWSEHAYGRAIDLNPVQNPYVSASGTVLPERGRRYADRTQRHPAMIRSGDRVVRAFASIGWSWGGDWRSTKDYQHFSQTGR